MEWREITDAERKKGWLIVAAFVGMVSYLVFFSTGGGGWYQCPFHWLTGYSCPGCGMTRSTAAALHGDLLTSLTFHPFGAVFLLAFVFVAIRGIYFNLRGERPVPSERLRRWSNYGWWVVFGFIAGFGAIRLGLELAGILTPI